MARLAGLWITFLVVTPLLFSACGSRGRNALGLNSGTGTNTFTPGGNNGTNNGGTNNGGTNNGGTNNGGTNGGNNNTGGNGAGQTFQNRLVFVTALGHSIQDRYDYGSRGPGSQTDRTFHIKNLRSVASSGQVFTGLPAGFQMVSNDCVAPIAPNATCQFVVRFSPAAAQDYSASLTVSYTGATGSESLSLDLRGTGLARANIVPDSEIVDFGPRVINGTYTLNLVLRNVGRLDGYLGFAGLSSPFSLVSPPELIAVNGVATITVRFQPTQIQDYDQVLRIAFADVVDDVREFRVRVRGQGATRANVTANPTEIDFGLREVGVTHHLEVKLRNSGSLAGNLSYSGLSAPLSAPTAPTVAPGGNQEVSLAIRYHPTQAGTLDQTITIAVSDALGSVGSITVRVRGRSAVRASLAVNPGSLNFGTRYTHAPYDATIAVTNTGGLIARIGLHDLSAPFSVSGPQEIAPGATASVSVRFYPTSPGRVQQTLRITFTDDLSTQGTRTAPLHGFGLRAHLATGADAGGGPHVINRWAFDPNAIFDSFFAYHPSFRGGVSVASCDLDGDGIPETVTGAGPGGGPHVEVFHGSAAGKNFDNGASMRASFFAYHPDFRGGVSVACGDLNGDGHVDLITGARAGGGPHVIVWNGARTDWNWDRGYTMLGSFFAYHPSFTGGVWVAVGDVNGDGRSDLVTGAGPGGGPHVIAYNGHYTGQHNWDNGGTMLTSFWAYHPDFRGGVHVAVGDVNGDGREEMITGAGPGGGPHVIAYDWALGPQYNNGGSMRLSFFAFHPSFRGGVRVATTDVNRDGHYDVVASAGPGGGPHVIAYNSAAGPSYDNVGSMFSSFWAYDPGFTGGVFVGASRPNTSKR